MRKTLFTLMMALCVVAVASVASSIAKNSNNRTAPDSIEGVISDSKCGKQHEDASDKSKKCVATCFQHGADAVLISGDKIYKLDQQEKAKEFPGEKVKVTGSVSGDSISVTSIERQ